MLELQFFGRKTNTEGDLGPHIRANLSNGNFKLSSTVMTKCGFQQGDRVNFAYSTNESGEVEAIFMAKEPKGLVIGGNHGFTTLNHAQNFKSALEDQIEEGHEVVILSVDVENPQTTMHPDEGELNVYEVTFQESQPQKKATNVKPANKKTKKAEADVEA